MNTIFGIEKISIHPSTLGLDIAALCKHRGANPEIMEMLMTEQRSILPPWEDTVTMAVNAAKDILNEEDRQAIGLLIVGTETGVDQEKPVSSWVHHYLGLKSSCRNFEIKHACYAATAALQMALSWLRSTEDINAKALIISSDLSLIGFSERHENIYGAGAVAVLLSRKPRMIAYESGRSGVCAQDISDAIRPTPRVDIINSETSLFSYLDALEGAYDDYSAGRDIDYAKEFDWHVYHMPFPGMAWRAHRRLMSLQSSRLTEIDMRAHFDSKVKPSLAFNRYLGSTYGGSTLMGLLSLAANAPVKAGDRVSIFAYGSGSCAEFYDAVIQADAAAVAKEANVQAKLDARTLVSIEEYEACERWRDASTGLSDYQPLWDLPNGCFDQHYAGRGLLVLDHVAEYCRHYRWS